MDPELNQSADGKKDDQPNAQDLWNAELATRNGKDPDDTSASGANADESTGAEAGKDDTKQAAESAAAAAEPDKFAKLEQALSDMRTELSRHSGRVSALQSAMDRATAKAGSAASPDQRQAAQAMEDPEEWKQLKADFPEWAAAVEKFIVSREKSVAAPAASAPDSAAVQDAVAKAVEKEVARRESERVERVHPGWRATTKTPEFKSWFDTQDAATKALAESDYAEDAIALMNKFKDPARVKAAQTAQRRAQALEVSAVKDRPATPAGPKGGGAELTPADVWKLEKQARAARRAA